MYVCLCQGVTDTDIVAAIESGADSLDDLQAELGAATGCGSCREFTEQLISSTKAKAGQLGYAA